MPVYIPVGICFISDSLPNLKFAIKFTLLKFTLPNRGLGVEGAVGSLPHRKLRP